MPASRGVRHAAVTGPCCSLLGLDQAGVAETVQFVLGKYPAARQQRLAGCVFVTGGCGRLPGMKERLERELRQMRPFQTR